MSDETPNEEESVVPVTLQITDADGRSADVIVSSDTADAILGRGAVPLLKIAALADDDPNNNGDSFSHARNRIYNAIEEAQAAIGLHPMMMEPNQPVAQARHIAQQQLILVFNMLGQAGILEARMAERRRDMEEMAKKKSIQLPDGVEV